MDHVHWSGMTTDTVPYDGQSLTIGFSTNPNDPIGTVVIRGAGETTLSLPNSVSTSPTWQNIPGTTPALQARQDGHFHSTFILIRLAP